MSTFTITGSPLRHKFWVSRLQKAQNMIKKYQDTIVDISSVVVPTPSSMIIKFSVTNTGKKYELVIQGSYADQYKKVQEGEAITPESINAESIIRNEFTSAYEIN